MTPTSALFGLVTGFIVVGCTWMREKPTEAGLKSEFGQCRPEVTTSPSSRKPDSELSCDIRAGEEPAASKNDSPKAQ